MKAFCTAANQPLPFIKVVLPSKTCQKFLFVVVLSKALTGNIRFLTFTIICTTPHSQPIQRRRKDVVKRLIFGLKDVLDWPEMEFATTFF